jgi:hypothetical protein
MRKPTLFVLPVAFVIVIFLTFCDKKEDPAPETNSSPSNTTSSTTSSIAPVLRTTPTNSIGTISTAANPNINIVTVTGTSTLTNPATQNSAVTVGTSLPGWTFNACATSPNTLTGYNGSCQIQIVFGGGTISPMNYAFTSGIPTAGQARMTVIDAPGQPTGVQWYSKNGIVSVATGTAGPVATFSNIQCLQQNFLFPIVTVSGNLVCY